MLVLRPYVTSGIAVVGAGLLAVASVGPATSPPAGPQPHAVGLSATDSPFADLFDNTVDNLQNIAEQADPQAITDAFGAILTDPLGVLGALTDISPDISTDLSSLPAQVSVELSPALELGIAGLGAFEATVSAINGVVADLMSGDSSQDTLTALIDGGAAVTDAYLNGQEGFDLLGGAVNVPLFNGILAPDQSLQVDLNLTDLLDTLGLGDLNLADLDLSGLLDQIGLGDLNLGQLFDELGISGDGLGDLLGGGAGLTLGDALDDFGLSGLDLGSFSLSDILDDLGLNELVDLDLTGILDGLGLNPDLDDLSLSDVLDPLGLNAVLGNLGLNDVIDSLGLDGDLSDLSLGGLLDDLGLGDLQLGTLLADTGLLGGVLDALNGVLGGLFSGLGGLLSSVLDALGLSDLDHLLSLSDLENALNDVDLGHLLAGTLLGSGQDDGDLSLTGLLDALGLGGTETDDSFTITGLVDALLGQDPTTDTSLGELITGILGSAGVDIPDTGQLTISDLLGDLLGAAGLPSTGDLTLGSLLDSLNIFNLDVTDLLNTVDLGSLLDMLGLSGLDLDLSGIVDDLSNLDLDGLLDDLGLSGDLASISVNPFGGLITEIVDDLPGQIAAAVGGGA